MTENVKKNVSETILDAMAKVTEDLNPQNVIDMVMQNIKESKLISGIATSSSKAIGWAIRLNY